MQAIQADPRSSEVRQEAEFGRSLCLACITTKVTKSRRGDKVRHLERIQSNLEPSLFFSVKKNLTETKLSI